MSTWKDFLLPENGRTQTVPAYSIEINEGKARCRKEQLILEDDLIRETKPYEGTPDLYVTAGFINCHMHWLMCGDDTPLNQTMEEIARNPAIKVEQAVAHARDTLKLGVTFGWDKGPPGINALPVYAGMREAEKKGVPMTRFIHCPWAIMMEGSFGAPFGRMLHSEKEMDMILSEIKTSGAKAVKFIPETGLNVKDKSYKFLMNKEFFKDTRQKARELGLLFAVHAKGIDSLDQCIAAGVTCIEHGIQVTERQMQTLQEKDIYLGPTLYGLECRLGHAQIVNKGIETAAYEWEAVCDMVARAARLNDGKPFTHMLFSSDAGSYTTPHASIKELYLLRKYGYDAAWVFEAATVNGARCTRQEHMGTLRENKAANLVYWHKNPLELTLEEWEHLEDYIAGVVLEGRLAHRE